MPTVLFVGGGSIGHIAPALAVWHALREQNHNVQAHFVCTARKEDQQFLRNTDIPFTAFETPRVGLSLLWTFHRAMTQAKELLDQIKPDVIFSKGSNVSIPVCLAAHRRGIPIILHESDAVMGRANRIVARWAKHICTGFPIAATMNYEPSTINHTGNPIRPGASQGNRAEGRRLTGLSSERPVLLVMGGSQGSLAINQIVATLLPTLLKSCDVIHLTGKGKELKIKADGYWSHSFVTEELPHIYALADIAVSRAGANSIAELAANAIPTILVPLRGVGHDHQQHNAVFVEREQGCVLLQQKTLRNTLIPTVEQLIDDGEMRESLGRQLHRLHKTNAAECIAKILQQELA